jgi:hypothetical protein
MTASLPSELVIPGDAHKWANADNWGREDYVSEAAVFLALHLYEHFHDNRMPYGPGCLWDRLWRACGGLSGLGGYFSQVEENGWPPVSRHQQGGLLYREPGVGVGLSRAGKRYFSEWPVERLIYGIVRFCTTLACGTRSSRAELNGRCTIRRSGDCLRRERLRARRRRFRQSDRVQQAWPREFGNPLGADSVGAYAALSRLPAARLQTQRSRSSKPPEVCLPAVSTHLH